MHIFLLSSFSFYSFCLKFTPLSTSCSPVTEELILIDVSNQCQHSDMQENPEDRDAEARVNAVKGLVSVCETLTHTKQFTEFFSEEDCISLFLVIKNEVIQSLLRALDDYSVDNRGDVGSWVREAAIEGLEKCTYILCKRDSKHLPSKSDILSLDSVSKMDEKDVLEIKEKLLFDENLATCIVGGIVKQAMEKMDKLRELSANTLQRILYNKEIFVPFIPYRERLEYVVPNNTDLKWGVSE